MPTVYGYVTHLGLIGCSVGVGSWPGVMFVPLSQLAQALLPLLAALPADALPDGVAAAIESLRKASSTPQKQVSHGALRHVCRSRPFPAGALWLRVAGAQLLVPCV